MGNEQGGRDEKGWGGTRLGVNKVVKEQQEEGRFGVNRMLWRRRWWRREGGW